jgi:mannose/cellobiose epimerase-like protein (N-acyl-D-glucosamine 2-epimerase family)
MFNAALPWWAANGVDREDGGYVEQVTPEGVDAGIAFKRTRVTARQIYVFSHAHMLGFAPGLDLAQDGVDYLAAKDVARPGQGFARKLTREGALLDPTPDLYDHAFVLFALAWHHKATGDVAASRDWMHRTLDYIETHLRSAMAKASGTNCRRKAGASRTRTCI